VDLFFFSQRFSAAGSRGQNRLEMYRGIGDILQDYGGGGKSDVVNQQGVGVRREIIWLPESNTHPNTVLENRKCSKFSNPLTNGKSSEMESCVRGSVINDQTAVLRIHPSRRSRLARSCSMPSDSESDVEFRQDPECVASGEFEMALGRQPRKRRVPIRERRIKGLGN
jgi:hypothetical protein